MTAAEELGALLASGSHTLAVAESCTGGLIGHLITMNPGSSSYFLGGVIAYSDTSKMEMLEVPRDTLRRQGAVSERTVLAMASEVRGAFGADFGLAVTGIAGPSGGSETKPVGTVFIAVVGELNERAEAFLFTGSREEINSEAAAIALRMTYEFVQTQGEP